MELLRIADVMARYGIGRARAVEWAELSGGGASEEKGTNISHRRREARGMAEKEGWEMTFTIKGRRYRWNPRRAWETITEAAAFVATAALVWVPVFMILYSI